MSSLLTAPRAILPPELEERIATQLIGTEEVIWWGMPAPETIGRRFMAASLVGAAFVIFALYWFYTVFQHALQQPDPDWTMAWFGIPIMAFGAGLMCTPLYVAGLARKSCYVLTNGRVLVLRALPLGMFKIEHFFPAHLRDMQCHEDESGFGDLVFKEIETVDGEGRTCIKQYGLLAIEQPREVEKLIRRTLQIPEELRYDV